MQRVYKRERYVVWKSDDCGYIVQNILMDGFAHSHIDSLNVARWLVKLSIHKKLPHDLSRYLIISLRRINDDERYIRKIDELLENKRKKDVYFNSNKGVKKCRKPI